MVEQWDLQDDARRIGSRPKAVAEYFALEQPLLRPLPEEPFETGRLFTPRVDRYGQIPVRTNRYSVPIRLIGKRVRVVLHASHLVVYDQNVEVARQPSGWTWITTWKSWSASPAPSPAPRPSNKPARQAGSPRSTMPSQALKPMPSHFHMGHESHAAEPKPQRLHADKAYDVPHLRKWLWGKHIGVRIARKGIESSERLGSGGRTGHGKGRPGPDQRAPALWCDGTGGPVCGLGSRGAVT